MENEELDVHHISSSVDTPIVMDAVLRPDKEKMERIEEHFKTIMEILGLDLTDDSLKHTPGRVAKMYVKEIFSGLNPRNKPTTTLFENKFGYNQMLVEKDISVYSMCEHHFVPILGKCHVAYIANGKVIGLSKIHRIVKFYSKRPQVQERLTRQIAEALKSTLKTDNIAVVIDARHMCVESRGIEDTTSSTVTAAISGEFQKEATRTEFLRYIGI